MIQSSPTYEALQSENLQFHQRLKREQQRRAHLQHIIDRLPHIVLLFDIIHREIIAANRYISSALGYTSSEMQAFGSTMISTLVHMDDQALLLSHYEKLAAASDDTALELEYRLRHQDGTWHWFLARDTVFLRMPNGRVQQILSTLQDITERKQQEAAQREAEERSMRAIAGGQLGIWEWNLETGELYLAPHLKTMLGYAEHETLDQFHDWVAQIYPDDIERLMGINQLYLSGGMPVYDVEYRMYRKDCSIRWVNIKGTTTARTMQGRPLRLSGVCTDITSKKQIEESLRQSHHLLASTFASMRDAVFLIDADSVRITDCNPAASVIFGYSREEMLGLTTSFLHIDVAAVEEFKTHLLDCVQQHTATDFPTRVMKRKDGTVIHTEHSVMPLTDLQGKRIGWVNVVRDITERNRMEEALRQAHDELEQRVQERTQELARSNMALQREMDERTRHERQREAVLSVSAALRTASTRAEMVSILLEQVGKLLRADGAILLTGDRQQSDVVIEQGYGIWSHMTGVRVVAEDESMMHTATASRPDQASVAQRDLQVTHSYLFSTVKSLACIPLIAHDQSVGTIGIGCQHVITSSDMHLLSAIGDMVANALRRVTLHEQTERRLQHVQALHSIDQAITTSLNLLTTLG